MKAQPNFEHIPSEKMLLWAPSHLVSPLCHLVLLPSCDDDQVFTYFRRKGENGTKTDRSSTDNTDLQDFFSHFAWGKSDVPHI